MAYFLTTKSFADVPVSEAGIDTPQFLEAADGLVKMFDLLGVGVFSFVQADLRGNISTVRKCYTSAPEACITLEKFVENQSVSHGGQGIGSLRLLLRGLSFTSLSLRFSRESPDEDLQASFKRSYDLILRPHHNFAIRTIVTVALRACPHKQVFFARLAQGEPQEEFDQVLKKWLDAIDAIVQHMSPFLDARGHGKI